MLGVISSSGSRTAEPLRVQDVDVEPPHSDASITFLQTITLFFNKKRLILIKIKFTVQDLTKMHLLPWILIICLVKWS